MQHDQPTYKLTELVAASTGLEKCTQTSIAKVENERLVCPTESYWGKNDSYGQAPYQQHMANPKQTQ